MKRLFILALCLIVCRSFPTLGGFQQIDAATAEQDPEIQAVINSGLQKIVNEGLQKGEFSSPNFELTQINSASKQVSDNGANYQINCEFANDENVAVDASFQATYQQSAQKITIDYSYTVKNITITTRVQESFIPISSQEIQFSSEIQNILSFGVNQVIQKIISNNNVPNATYKISQVNSVSRQIYETALFYQCNVLLSSDEGITIETNFTVYYQPLQDVKTLTDYVCKVNGQGSNNSETAATTAIIAPADGQYTPLPDKEVNDNDVVKSALDYGSQQITDIAINENKIPNTTTLEVLEVNQAESQIVGNGIFYKFTCTLGDRISVTLSAVFTIYMDAYTLIKKMTDYSYETSAEDNTSSQEQEFGPGGFVDTEVEVVVPQQEQSQLEFNIEFVEQSLTVPEQEVTQIEPQTETIGQGIWIFEQVFPIPSEEEVIPVVIVEQPLNNEEQQVSIFEEVFSTSEQEIIIQPISLNEEEVVISVPQEEEIFIPLPIIEEQIISIPQEEEIVIPMPVIEEQIISVQPGEELFIPTPITEELIINIPSEEEIVIPTQITEEQIINVQSEEDIFIPLPIIEEQIISIPQEEEIVIPMPVFEELIISVQPEEEIFIPTPITEEQIISVPQGEEIFIPTPITEEQIINVQPEEEIFIPLPIIEEAQITVPVEEEAQIQTETQTVSADGFTQLDTSQSQFDAETNNVFQFGTSDVIMQGNADGKIPNQSFKVAKVTDAEKKSGDKGDLYRFSCEAINSQGNSMLVMSFTVYYQFSSKRRTLASFSYDIKSVNSGTTSSSTTASDNTIPVISIEGDYVRSTAAQIQSDQAIQNALNYGASQVYIIGIQAGKIPVSSFTIKTVVSVFKLTTVNGASYKCNVILENKDNIDINAEFIVSYDSSTQENSLVSYSYTVSKSTATNTSTKKSTGMTTTAPTTTTDSSTQVTNTGYTAVNQDEISSNSEIQSCIKYGAEQLIPDARDYTLSEINSVSRQVVESAIYYKFDIELTQKNQVAYLNCIVYYQPATDQKDIIAYAYKTQSFSNSSSSSSSSSSTSSSSSSSKAHLNWWSSSSSWNLHLSFSSSSSLSSSSSFKNLTSYEYSQMSVSTVESSSKYQDILNYGVEQCVQDLQDNRVVATSDFQISDVLEAFIQENDGYENCLFTVRLNNSAGISLYVNFNVQYDTNSKKKSLTSYSCEGSSPGENQVLIADYLAQFALLLVSNCEKVSSEEVKVNSQIQDAINYGVDEVKTYVATRFDIDTSSYSLKEVKNVFQEIVDNSSYIVYATLENDQGSTFDCSFYVTYQPQTNKEKFTFYTYVIY